MPSLVVIGPQIKEKQNVKIKIKQNFAIFRQQHLPERRFKYHFPTYLAVSIKVFMHFMQKKTFAPDFFPLTTVLTSIFHQVKQLHVPALQKIVPELLF